MKCDTCEWLRREVAELRQKIEALTREKKTLQEINRRVRANLKESESRWHDRAAASSGMEFVHAARRSVCEAVGAMLSSLLERTGPVRKADIAAMKDRIIDKSGHYDKPFPRKGK